MTKIDWLLLRNIIITMIIAFAASFIIWAAYAKMEKWSSSPYHEQYFLSNPKPIVDYAAIEPIEKSNCPVSPWIDQMEVLKKYLVKGNPNYKEDDN